MRLSTGRSRSPDEASQTGQPPSQRDESCRKPGAPLSKLRRTAVKLEKNRSHQKFLETCHEEGVLPSGFRLKWKCHFDEDNKEIAAILEKASKELVSTCAVLAGEKVSRLEEEYGSLLQSVLETGEDSARNIERVIEEDVKRSKVNISKVKHRKLERLRNGRPVTDATDAPEKASSSTVKSNLSPERAELSPGHSTVKSKLSPEGAKLSPVEIVNQSSRTLSAAELSVLKRGLSFVPTRKQPPSSRRN